MRKLHQRYPDDLDLATLFAQSLMDLTPWDYWTPKGEPKGDTTEIVRTLEYVFKRRPDHPGANHYYIHAVEASGRPERAEAAADRLNDAELSAGHLVHMPSHIYIQVGRYEDAGEVNRRAAAADEQFFAWCSGQGVYRTLYYPHTIHFEWSAANFAGSSAISLSAGRKLAAKVSHVNAAEAPYVQQFLPSPILSLVRFGRWDAILGERKPSSHLRYPTGIWHYARGIAFARLGDLRQARAERGELAKIAAEPTVADLRLARSSGRQMLDIAQEHLKGELAARSGDYAAAVEALRQAVRLQDELAYAEPPAWYFPQRQALGAVLLEAGRPREAEQTYREDLERNPRNGWSLFGLAQSMRQQGRTSDAILVERGFAAAWEHADVKLTASRF